MSCISRHFHTARHHLQPSSTPASGASLSLQVDPIHIEGVRAGGLKQWMKGQSKAFFVQPRSLCIESAPRPIRFRAVQARNGSPAKAPNIENLRVLFNGASRHRVRTVAFVGFIHIELSYCDIYYWLQDPP
jgi:hypothetical protein